MKKKVKYKIFCEWDMGMDWEKTVFSTRKAAEKEIKSADWSMVDMTLDQVKAEGLVSIEEVISK